MATCNALGVTYCANSVYLSQNLHPYWVNKKLEFQKTNLLIILHYFYSFNYDSIPIRIYTRQILQWTPGYKCTKNSLIRTYPFTNNYQV